MFGVAILFACLALCHGGPVLPVVAPVHHAAVVAPVTPVLGFAGAGFGGVGFGAAGLTGAGHLGAGYGPGLGAGYGADLGAGHGAGYGAGLGAGYGAGLGAGYGAGLGAGYGAGLGAGNGAGLGAGYGAGIGSGFGAGAGTGLGAQGVAGAGLANGHHILKRSPTLVAPVAHHVAPVAVSHQSRVDLSQYGTSVVHSAALPVVAPAVHGGHGFGAGYGYY